MASNKSKAATAVQDGSHVTSSAGQVSASELTTVPKPKGKLKDAVSTVSTVLPIAGAIGTMGVWLAANFYVADIQIEPDRAFNTLEVRVSDKKGQESVFHSPHFQVMPGHYHMEVTVDSQYKQHVDVKAVFHHKSTIALHVPGAVNTAAGASSAPGAVGAVITSGNVMSLFAPEQAGKPVEHKLAPEQNPAPVATAAGSNESASEAQTSESPESRNTSAKKHWWQIWKKSSSQN